MKQYSVSLNEELVNEVKKVYTTFDGKISPLINMLLEQWLKQKRNIHG